MFRFFLLAATAFLAAAQCPVLHTKTGLRKTINGGKTVTLTVKVTNRGAAFNDGGFALQLPNNVAYKSVKVSPKLATAPSFEQDDNGMVAWAGIAMHAKKTRTFRVKLAFDKCAGDDSVPSKHNNGSMFSTEIGVATFTGPIDDMQCMVSKTVPVHVRRPKTATDCLPPTPPGVACDLPAGFAFGLNFFGCQTAPGSGILGGYEVCGDLAGFTTPPDLQDCFNYCAENVAQLAAVVYIPDINNCKCYASDAFPAAFGEGPPAFNTYSVGATNPALTSACDR